MKTTNLRGVGGGGVLTVHVKQRVAGATLEDYTSHIIYFAQYIAPLNIFVILHDILSPCKPASCMMLGVSP